jgi:hypothetical protein
LFEKEWKNLATHFVKNRQIKIERVYARTKNSLNAPCKARSGGTKAGELISETKTFS